MKIQFINKIVEFVKDKQLRKQFLYIFALLAFIIFAVFSDYGLLNTIKLQNECSKVIEQNHKETIIRDSLVRHIKSLRYDTLYIERVAREKYGLIKPGEKIFIVNQDDEEKK